MIHFLSTFLLMLLSGSILLLGFYTITRGKIIKLPNGKEEIGKEILGDWQLFWEGIEGYYKCFFHGEQLLFKLKILEQLRPEMREHISLTEEGRAFIFDFIPNKSQVRDIEFSLNCKVWQKEDVLFLYDEFPFYRFSEWIRKITNCYVCLSSIGGTIYYWTMLYFFPLYIPQTSHKLLFWVIFCISLSFVNKSIKEYFDNSQK